MKINLSQLLGAGLIVVALFFDQFNIPLPGVDPLSPEEKSIAASFEGKIDGPTAKLVASNLEAASNFLDMDSQSQNPMFPDEYTIKQLKGEHNKILWAYRVDIPSKFSQFSDVLYKLYEAKLGEKFSKEDVANFNRKVAKALRNVS